MKTKTKLVRVAALIAFVAAFQVAWAQINSTYIGPDGGNWNDASNWSPMIVPNNNGGNVFNVTIDGPRAQLDIDPTINSLTLGATAGRLFGTDHNFTVTGSTSMGDRQSHRRRRAITSECEVRSRESNELLGHNLELRRLLRDLGAGHNFQAPI